MAAGAKEGDADEPLRRVVADVVPNAVEPMGGEVFRPSLRKRVVLARVDGAGDAERAGSALCAVGKDETGCDPSGRQAAARNVAFEEPCMIAKDFDEAPERPLSPVAGPSRRREIEPRDAGVRKPPHAAFSAVDAVEGAASRDGATRKSSEVRGRRPERAQR